MVDELEVAPVWMATVQGAVAKFNEASPDEQEVICLRLGENYGPWLRQGAYQNREQAVADCGECCCVDWPGKI